MLPHARAGGIAGLLEILADLGGREELHRIAENLKLEVDDLLPIVDAAALLGFLTIDHGDAIITEPGREFAAADIQGRKRLFREALLARVPLFQQIASALRAKTDGTIPAELFRDLLDEHCSEAESQRQLDIAIQWGRYAELFDYDSVKERLSRTEP
jgi:NitT/TauT family transport system ATP-binding protein